MRNIRVDNAKGYIIKESKKHFFVEYVQKIAVQSQPNTYKVREKRWGAVQIQNKKEQHTAIRNDISFSFQKLPFQFQFYNLYPKIARPKRFIKPPPADLT